MAKERKEGVLSYIREHWVPYLIGAVAAVLLGFGLAYFLGVKWSTPESVRLEREAEKEETQSESVDSMLGSAQ